MKVAITGHTSGLGKILYNYFVSQNYEVIGMSRSNGYNIESDQDKIIENLTGADIFINNAHSYDYQTELMHKAVNKVDYMILSGSALQLYKDYATYSFLEEKSKLHNEARLLSNSANVKTHILHIGIAFLPESSGGLKSDNFTEYQDLINIINFWLENPSFSDVILNWKLTPFLLNQLSAKFGELDIPFKNI